MAMLAAYLNLIRDAGQAAITHCGLTNASDVEPTGGTPAYARKAATWADGSAGVSNLSGDLTFDIPAGTTVARWHGYSAITTGTDYGGGTFSSPTGPYGSQGTFTLLASGTSITHAAA